MDEHPATIADFSKARAPRSPVRSKCPDCSAPLTVLRIIPGRAHSEYWTMRCVRCGGLHLDILTSNPEPVEA